MSLTFQSILIDGSQLLINGDKSLKTEDKWISLADFYIKCAQEAGFKTVNKEAIIEQARRNAFSFENSVRIVLQEINLTKTGQAVLKSIKNQTFRHLEIIPYFIKAGFDLNAYAKSNPAPPLHIPHRDPFTESSKKGIARIRELRSKNAIICFTPRQWGGYGPVHATTLFRMYDEPIVKADEVLLHELVHGLRKMTGTGNSLWAYRSVPGQALQKDMEEFYAVLIANIYRSECKREGLRKYYKLFPTFYTTSNEEFLKIELNRRHLRQLRRQNTALFNDLNDVDAAFNPTKEFKDR